MIIFVRACFTDSVDLESCSKYTRISVTMTSSEVSSYNRKIISEDLSNVEFDTSEDVEVIPTFDSMGLKDELLRGIYTYGNHLLGYC